MMLDKPTFMDKKIREFPKSFKWLNTKKQIDIGMLKGQIVILDFWTYCCINCVHMAQTLNYVDERYKNKPVVIIGIHSAKYANEKNPSNIADAINRYGIVHPVIVDENMHLWKEYGIHAWPTLVFLGPDGTILHKAAGEISNESLSEIIDDLLDRYTNEKLLSKKRADVYLQYKSDDEEKNQLRYPGKIAISENGKLIAISDTSNNRVLILDRSDNRVMDTIGCGYGGFLDGNFDNSRLLKPQGVFFRKNILYIADTGNHSIRAADMRNRRIITIAGDGERGVHMSFNNKYIAKETSLLSPWDLSINGKFLYIAMAGLNQIWRYDFDDETIMPFAGAGYENIVDGELEKALMAQPSGLFCDNDYIYVVDSETSSVRSINISKNFISTIIGAGLFIYGDNDGKFNVGRLQHPLGITKAKDKIYVADTYNNSIRLIDLSTKNITTLIKKDSESQCRFEDKNCDTLGLYEPSDVKIYKEILYIADTNNHLIRTFDLNKKILNTIKIYW